MNIYSSQQIPQTVDETPVVFRTKKSNQADTRLFYVTSVN